MVLNFKYDGTIMDIMPVVKDYLESKKYDIIHYAPEAGYILTDFKLFSLNSGKVNMALSINIKDLVVVVWKGKYEIVTSGIGNPDDMLNITYFDDELNEVSPVDQDYYQRTELIKKQKGLLSLN